MGLINSNKYWEYNEDNVYAHWGVHINAHNQECFDEVISKFLSIAYKYGITYPLVRKKADAINEGKRLIFDNISEEVISTDLLANLSLYELGKALWQKNLRGNYISIIYFYITNNYETPPTPSILFYKDEKGEIRKEGIYDIKRFQNKKMDFSTKWLRPPISLSGLGGIHFDLNSDVFFSELNYKIDPDNQEYFSVNNYDLAMLNTPRLNSFLRDFKILSKEYGLSLFYEDMGLDSTTKEGILLDGELIYYEDIEDLLEDKYKIENLFKGLDNNTNL